MLWPNGGEITYYFENDQARDKLFSPLQAALEKWYASGLPEANFKFTAADEKTFKNDRANVLLIKYNDKGKLSSTIAIPAKADSEDTEGGTEETVGPDNSGPTMQLSDSTSVGMLDVVANFAHELGHVWGLLHEHQNPVFWTSPYSTGSLENQFQFNCHNLLDWDEVSNRVTDPQVRIDMCQSRSVAAENKFTAAEFLPINGARGPNPGALGTDVDWSSIMLYPSGSGGVGAASPGNDGRAHVLLKEDGSVIPPNLNPSVADVQGLIDLYKTFEERVPPVLINEPASSKRSKFKSLFGKKKCL